MGGGCGGWWMWWDTVPVYPVSQGVTHSGLKATGLQWADPNFLVDFRELQLGKMTKDWVSYLL